MARQVHLCHYAYDPLDRLASRTDLAAAITRDFYRTDRLAAQIQGVDQRSFVHHDNHLLAHRTVVGKLLTTTLAATDPSRSVLHADEIAIAYSPYGHRAPLVVLPGLPGYNGEQPDSVTGHYLLGNGHRAYNPTLMRFNRPDSLSPFGKGGLNPYAYCLGDPINRLDPSGKASWSFIVQMVISIAALAIAVLTTNPSIPFLLSIKAAQAGFVSVGSASAIATSAAGVSGGLLAIGRTVAGEYAPDSPLLEPLGWTAAVLSVTAMSARFSAVIAAKNPKNLADIKAAIEQYGKPALISEKPIDEVAMSVDRIRGSHSGASL